jgi:two-component system chemotaxis response regulator CheV
MPGTLDGVDQRTRLVGRNRLELLLFRLSGRQRYGINVFKVREVVQCPRLTRVPHANPHVRGIASMRGTTVGVIDLGAAIGATPLAEGAEPFVILAEFNRSIQGFLVSAVERIVNLNWEEVVPPPRAAGLQSYMTAVTQVDGELVEIIDVERVLAEITGEKSDVSAGVTTSLPTPAGEAMVLVVDDSSVARRQVGRTLDQLGVRYEVATNGREALDRLRAMAEQQGGPIGGHVRMVISDIEMPEMDGYTLTKLVKEDPRLQDLFILLHTSLSGVFNASMVRKVGADAFVAKFDPDELARAVGERVFGPGRDETAVA